ncbi:MAG TPA: homocysteine S-methyltransferase [Actinomycetota bacterium]
MERSPFDPILTEGRPVLLDGGMGTELDRRGANLRDPLWSAKVLLESPELIRQVHAAYFSAGADVAISASYQASFEGLAARGLGPDRAAGVLRRSVDLAREAASEAGGRRLVAASVGPYGAVLGNGAEYTGDYDRGEDELVEFHGPRFEALAEARPDVFAVETIPSIVEARSLVRALDRVSHLPAWISFSCRDGAHLCDGTPFRDAVEVAASAPNVVAVGVNCTSPLHVTPLIEIAAASTHLPVVCYPNRGAFWDPIRKSWVDPPRQDARPPLRPTEWRTAGAAVIGGCCGTTPEDIAAMASALAA